MAAAYRVLDVHHHIGDASQALAMPPMEKPASAENGIGNDMRIRVETMDRSGVDAALVIPAHNYLRPEGLADTRRTKLGFSATGLVPDWATPAGTAWTSFTGEGTERAA